MAEPPSRRAKAPTPNRHRAPEELARLEAALRANLKRRRAQKVARSEPAAEENEGKQGQD